MLFTRWFVVLKGLAEVKAAIAKTKVDLNADIRKIFFTGVREVIKETPVDTGRARANWQGTAKNLPVHVLGQKFVLSNNLPYINKLEMGHSKQAPSGWVRKAVIRMQNKLRAL